jgi:DNA-directed RNA polymerase subunit beta'
MDRFEFRRINQELAKCLKISDKGDTEYRLVSTIVPKEAFEEQANAKVEAMGGTPAKGKKPSSATASTQLLGITKASVQSSSFIRLHRSRKPPRYSPKQPWQARSTAWLA